MPSSNDRRGLSAGVNRRQLLAGSLGVAASVPALRRLQGAKGAGGVAGARSSKPLVPTFYQWVVSDHPAINGVDKAFGKNHPLNVKIAPVSGFGDQNFIAEAKQKTSSWDLYIGETPFVDTASLVAAGALEPWDKYIPKSVLDDIIPSIRKECTYEGKLYTWPFFLDVTVQSWNAAQVTKAGLDPTKAPTNWDEFLANSRKVKSSGAAPFGCTFDAHGWRSLAPITYSINTKVYTEDNLFNFNHPAAIQALELMRQMYELANPDVLNPGTSDGGVNDTPDEETFIAQQAAYFIKYENAPIRCAAKWSDPSQLKLGAFPSGGAGATVFWDTGASLFKYGGNKQLAASYMKYLSYSDVVWQESLAAGSAQVGQTPPYQSVWNKWQASPPSWLPDWVLFMKDQLPKSQAIRSGVWGLQQFVVGQPYWQQYIKGQEKSAKQAMHKTMNAVRAAIKKANS